MGFLTLLHVIPITISAVYPGVTYKEIDMQVSTIAVVLRYWILDLELVPRILAWSTLTRSLLSLHRSSILNFYSIPPSPSIILAIRRHFFPGSGPVTMVMNPTIITVQGTSADTQSHKSDELKLPGEEEDQSTVTSKTRITAWDDQLALAGDEKSFWFLYHFSFSVTQRLRCSDPNNLVNTKYFFFHVIFFFLCRYVQICTCVTC